MHNELLGNRNLKQLHSLSHSMQGIKLIKWMIDIICNFAYSAHRQAPIHQDVELIFNDNANRYSWMNVCHILLDNSHSCSVFKQQEHKKTCLSVNIFQKTIKVKAFIVQKLLLKTFSFCFLCKLQFFLFNIILEVIVFFVISGPTCVSFQPKNRTKYLVKVTRNMFIRWKNRQCRKIQKKKKI